METTLANSMVLQQTSTDAAVGVTTEYEIAPGDAVDFGLVIVATSGTSPQLEIAFDVSNDRMNWTQEGTALSIPSIVAYYTTSPVSLASRWIRVRFQLTTSGMSSDGTAILSVTARRFHF